jgi:hypothetical protein
MLDIMIANGGRPSSELSQQIAADSLVAPLAPVDTYRLVMNSTSAVGYCGRAKNHARQAVAKVKRPKID